MGVVRDVTVDNLVTAVGNIDTSSLAQDSTLQDVVTAIGNISGGSDPVTNTTVNTLCKDTTGQSIASAISGLGATLGSDRALIDGSNIGDKATFRQNIGLPIQFIHTAVNASASVTAYVGRSDVFNLPTPSASANRYILLGWNATASNNNDLIICKFSNGNIICTRNINLNDYIYIQGIIF